MSTWAGHQAKLRARRWRWLRRLRELQNDAWNILRPAVLPFVAYGGLYLAFNELRVSPLHHNTVVWVVGFAIAGAALYGLWKEFDHRRRLRRWLRTDNRHELVEDLPRIRKVVPRLPPWDRARYLAKKREFHL